MLLSSEPNEFTLLAPDYALPLPLESTVWLGLFLVLFSILLTLIRAERRMSVSELRLG